MLCRGAAAGGQEERGCCQAASRGRCAAAAAAAEGCREQGDPTQMVQHLIVLGSLRRCATKGPCWCCTVCTQSRGTLNEWLPCDEGRESLAAHERAWLCMQVSALEADRLHWQERYQESMRKTAPARPGRSLPGSNGDPSCVADVSSLDNGPGALGRTTGNIVAADEDQEPDQDDLDRLIR